MSPPVATQVIRAQAPTFRSLLSELEAFWHAPLLEAVRDRRSVPWAEEAAADGRVQVTVNEYTPGVGIASHVDTHSAFEDGHATRAESAVLA